MDFRLACFIMSVLAILFFIVMQKARKDLRCYIWCMRYEKIYNRTIARYVFGVPSPHWREAQQYHAEHFSLLIDEIERHTSSRDERERAIQIINDRFYHTDNDFTRKINEQQ